MSKASFTANSMRLPHGVGTARITAHQDHCRATVQIEDLRDLAAREAQGEIPDLRRMSVMHQDEIVAALVPVRGIGRWTVEMMLMFRLGRPDVLPVDDLGIRKGAQKVDRQEAMPTPKELLARGAKWGPYRTYASLYLWRIADSADEVKKPTPRS